MLFRSGSFDAYMWQTLETKARFIQQVMNGQTSVRCAEDLDGGALTYAEIKAIASGNPAVMEKVKIDQLRAVHLNQQHKIRLEVRSLPPEIRERQEKIERLAADIARRDANTDDEFSMTGGNRVYSGKGAREQAAQALTGAVLSWRDDQSLQVWGSFRGFEILSRPPPQSAFAALRRDEGGFGVTRGEGPEDERLPELLIRAPAYIRRSSTRKHRSAPSRASSTPCGHWKRQPSRNGIALRARKRCWRTTRSRWENRLNTRRGSRICWSARRR